MNVAPGTRPLDGLLSPLGTMRSVLFCASLCLLGCSSDETGSGGGPGSPAASTGALGSGGASTTAVSSTVAASSSTGPCTMGGGGACPCPGDVCPVQLATGLAAASHLAESDTDLFYLASIDR